MLWDNITLMTFIRDRSGNINTYLLPRKPNPPEENPLHKDRISKEAIKLRENLDEIQGSDEDNQLTGQIVSAITLGSRVIPIPKDHPYTNEEVGDYLKYLDIIDEWLQLKDFLGKQENYNPYEPIKNIPILSCLYSIEKKDFIIVMGSNNNKIRELNTDPMESIIGGRYVNQMSYYRKLMPNEINDYLINIDFEELRKRLISSGYSVFVDEVNEQLQHYA